MSHIVGKNAYKSLEERLNKFPQGAPPSETLYKILNCVIRVLVIKIVEKVYTKRKISYIM